MIQVQVLEKITFQCALLCVLSGPHTSIFNGQAVSSSCDTLGTTRPTTQCHSPATLLWEPQVCTISFHDVTQTLQEVHRVLGWIDIGYVALRTESKPSVWTVMCLDTTNVLILDYICVRDRGCGTRQPNWTSDIGGFLYSTVFPT